MYCPNCGENNREGAKFCENCGTSLVETTEFAAETTPLPPNPDSQATVEIPTPQDQVMGTPHPPAQDAGAYAPGQTQEMPSQPAPPAGAPVVAQKSSGKAIAALVCGIASIVLSGSIILGIILGIIAIVLAAQALKLMPDGKAKAGRICGIIGLAFSAVTLVICIVTGAALFNFIAQNPSIISSLASSSQSSSVQSSSSSSAPSSSKGSSASSKSSSTTSSSTYKNSRYGYTLKVPSGFTKTAESANGDGATFENSKLGMTVTVSGFNNNNNLNPERYVETKWNGTTTSMNETSDNEALLYQVEGDKAVFYYAYIGAGSIDELKITYPEAGDDTAQLDAAEALLEGFEPGSIASTH